MKRVLVEQKNRIKQIMRHLNEGMSNAENLGLYDQMTDLLNRANILISNQEGNNPDEWEISNPDEALELLMDVHSDEAQELYNEIEQLNNKIDEADAEEYLSGDDDTEIEEQNENPDDDAKLRSMKSRALSVSQAWGKPKFEENDGDEINNTVTPNDLEVLKKINYSIPKQEVIDWFNQNDIEYNRMTDIEMYIKYIEDHNSKGNHSELKI